MSPKQIGSQPIPLKPEEVFFCYFLARTGDPAEAALKAGYAPARVERQAARLLQDPRVREELRRQAASFEEDAGGRAALAGLHRIAFGRSNDAVELALCTEEEELGTQLLDLYGVSEIRRPRGGGLELRFYDRLRALELLLQYGGKRESPDAAGFFEALSRAPDPFAGAGRMPEEEAPYAL